MARIAIREIRALLQDRAESLVRELLPDGRRQGNMWEAKNPTRDDRKAGSFKVWLRGDAAGGFKDYATGQTGDVIDLIAYLRGGDRGFAIAWAKDYLGIAHMDDRERVQVRQKVEARAAESAEREAQRLRWKREKALEKFKSGMPGFLGTPAENYFSARGCPLSEIPHICGGTYRYHPLFEWWKGAVYEEVQGRRVKVRNGPSHPALLAALKNEHGVFTGLHATYLLSDGSDKAELDPPKLVFGTAKGSVIRISEGPSGLSPEEDRVPRPLIITEGNEDGWAEAIAIPEARVWACPNGHSAIAEVPVWLDCVGEIFVARQNDIGNFQASEAVQQAIDRLAEYGKPVAPIDLPTSFGKDPNDAIRSTA
jgi:hypothetical protein